MEDIVEKLRLISHVAPNAIKTQNTIGLAETLQQQYNNVTPQNVKDLYKKTQYLHNIDVQKEGDVQTICEEISAVQNKLSKFGEKVVSPIDFLSYKLRPDLLDPFCHAFSEATRRRQILEQQRAIMDEKFQQTESTIIALGLALKEYGANVVAGFGDIKEIQKNEKEKQDLANSKADNEKLNAEISKKVWLLYKRTKTNIFLKDERMDKIRMRILQKENSLYNVVK